MTPTGSKGGASRDALVLALCHEVENTLAGVRLGAHLVANRLFDGDVASAAAKAELTVARTGAWVCLLRPLLVAAPPHRVPVSVGELLRALDRSVGAATGGPCPLEIRASRSLPDVRIDPDALHQALIVLALSAAEVTPPGGVVVVSVRRSGARVVFSVDDEGPPLDAAPRGSRAALRGRHMVLALVGIAMRRQGASVAWERRPRGRGTRVRISLRTQIARRKRVR